MNHRKEMQMRFLEDNQDLLSSAAWRFWKEFGKGALRLNDEDIGEPPWQPFLMGYLVGKKLKRDGAPESVLGLVERYDPAKEFVAVVFGAEGTKAFRIRPDIAPDSISVAPWRQKRISLKEGCRLPLLEAVANGTARDQAD